MPSQNISIAANIKTYQNNNWQPTRTEQTGRRVSSKSKAKRSALKAQPKETGNNCGQQKRSIRMLSLICARNANFLLAGLPCKSTKASRLTFLLCYHIFTCHAPEIAAERASRGRAGYLLGGKKQPDFLGSLHKTVGLR